MQPPRPRTAPSRLRRGGNATPALTALLLALVLTQTVASVPVLSAVAEPAPTPGRAASPAVLPALTHWEPAPGSFSLGVRSRILLATDSPGLAQTARTLAEDLQAQHGDAVPVLPRASRPHLGDIVLELDPARSDLAAEGYELIVGEVAHITAGTDDGAFYGTRTLLQALTTPGPVPAGRTVDAPRYPERGIEICPCMVKLSMPRMERLFREMAYLKLNYLLLPLKMISDTHPETNQWSYYTQTEARQLAALGGKYHVEVVPEINAPGHMEPFLFDRPDLQLTDVDGNRGPTRMDITKPEAFDFYTDLVDEYAEVFPGQFWHLGADEYMTFSSYQRYPQIAAHAREEFGPDARPEDAFIDFVNRVGDYVQTEHGRTLRIWNDGLPRRNIIPAEEPGHPQLDTDIVVEHWKPSEVTPEELLDAGYTVMNAASSLYEDRGSRPSGHALCPDEATLHGCVRPLWDSGWDPTLFEDGSTVGAGPTQLTGAHLSLWQTDPAAETERQMEQATALAMRLIAQRTWGQADPTGSYDGFVERVEAIGPAPGATDSLEPPLPADGRYLLHHDGADGGTLAAGTNPGSELRVDAAETPWQLRVSDDGYYRLEDPSSGLCADMELAGGIELLQSAPGVGAAPTMEPCAATANTQKWELAAQGGGLFTLTSALSQLPTRLEPGGGVVQDVPERPSASWRIELLSPATLAVATSRLLEPAQPNQVGLTFHNDGTQLVEDVRVTLQGPEGWGVEPAGAGLNTVNGGQTAEIEFTVTPPADPAVVPLQLLTARATFVAGDRESEIAASARVRIDPISCPDRDPALGPDDEFNHRELDGCRWTRVLNPDLGAMRVDDGRLHIVTSPGDLAGGPPDEAANVVLQEAPAGDWTIETKMEAHLTESYHQGGLVVHGDDDNYVEVVLATENAPGTSPNLYLSLVSERDGEFGAGGVVNVFGPAGDSDEEWWLRLTKSGDSYTASYSPDGRAWSDLPGAVTNDQLAEPSVGLLAAGPLQQTPTDIWFDYFHLEPSR